MMARNTLCNKATARWNTAPCRCVLMAMAASACFQLTAVELITNGGFEECEEGCTPPATFSNLSDSLRLSGWTWGGSVGMTKSYSGCPWVKTISVLDGAYALYFQKNSSITQTIDVVEAGAYVASFGYMARADNTCYGKGRFYVEIDGVEIGHADCGTVNNKFRLARFTTNLSVGSHTFVIRHSNELSTDGEKRSNSIMDALSLLPASDIDANNLLSNGSFENFTGYTYSEKWRGFDDGINIEGWSVDTGGTGLAKGSSAFLVGSPYDGNFVLFFNGDERSVSQPISVSTEGDYVVSFAYAARDTTYYYGGRIYAEVDGESVGYVDCTAVATFRRAMFMKHLSVGDHTFTLRHTTEADTEVGHVPCSDVDAVTVRPSDTLLLNGNFDEGNVGSAGYSGSTEVAYSNPGWTTSGSCGIAKPGVPGTPFVSSSIDSGVYSMYILTANYTRNGTGGRQIPPVSISQSFTAPKSGIYELRFSYASRPYNQYKGGTIYARIYRGEGLEGEKVWERSVVATSLNAFQQFVGEAKLYSAGKYTLEFYAPQPEYIENAENNLNSVLDNVSLEYSRKIKGFVLIVR